MSRLVAAAKEMDLQPMLPVRLNAPEDIDTLSRWHAIATYRHLHWAATSSLA
jgi:hypothetical protein